MGGIQALAQSWTTLNGVTYFTTNTAWDTAVHTFSPAGSPVTTSLGQVPSEKPFYESDFDECITTDGEGRIYLIGGKSSIDDYSMARFKVYEPGTDTWIQGKGEGDLGPELLAPPVEPVAYPDDKMYAGCGVSLEAGRVYLFGGKVHTYENGYSFSNSWEHIQSIGLDFSATDEDWAYEPVTLSERRHGMRVVTLEARVLGCRAEKSGIRAHAL